MKIKFVLLLVVLLTGCVTNSNLKEQSEYTNEIEDLEKFYENKTEELRLAHIKEIENLNNIIKELELELEVATSNYEEIKKEYDKLVTTISASSDNRNYLDVNLDDRTIRLYSDGTDSLEDGIVCNLQLLDRNKDILWHLSWEGLQVTELSTYSPVTVFEDRIYIVISGLLNAIDINTGEIIWDSVKVGSSFDSPLVDKDGCIYITGQYAPYLTAITSGGKVKWQINSEDFYGISEVSFIDEYLLVKQFDEEFLLNKDGEKIE